MSIINIDHRGPEGLRVGVVIAEGVSTTRYPDSFESDLQDLLAARHTELSDELDLWRRDVRDVFRNGRFKPTGRGKPASEYLLGAARKNSFPRINAVVDVCNYVSLRFVLPISVCDLDRAGTRQFMVRLGLAEEEYVFNSAGQTIDLEDLIVGCIVSEGGRSKPVINAVKDSMLAKTTPDSSRTCALLYAPLDDTAARLAGAVSLFAGLMGGCGDNVETASTIIDAGESVALDTKSAEG